MFEVLGLTEAEQSVYQVLVDHTALTVAELRKQTGLTSAGLNAALQRLIGKALVTQVDGAYGVMPPDISIGSLIAQQQESLRQLATAVGELSGRYHRSHAKRDASDLVTIITDDREVIELAEHIQTNAVREVLTFDRPPYLRVQTQPNEVEFAGLADGVRYATLYAQASYERHRDYIRDYVQSGEEARVLPELPMKFVIADREIAIMPLDLSSPTFGPALLLRQCSLVETLVVTFEMLWARAAPIVGAAEPATPDAAFDVELLELLAAGLKDESIARHLKVSVRTVVRRVNALMRELDARTRFQAGLQSARRGLLDPDSRS